MQFKFFMVAKSAESLEAAFQCIAAHEGEFKPLVFVGYKFMSDNSIGFFQYIGEKEKQSEVIPFPVPLTPEEAAKMAWNWLQKVAIFPKAYDTDGHCGKAFKIYNKDTGFWDLHYIAVEPEWIIYGK